jgi:hypothetical protein
LILKYADSSCRVEQEEKDLSKAIDQEIEEKRQLLLELSRGKVSWKSKHKNSFLQFFKTSKQWFPSLFILIFSQKWENLVKIFTTLL